MVETIDETATLEQETEVPAEEAAKKKRRPRKKKTNTGNDATQNGEGEGEAEEVEKENDKPAVGNGDEGDEEEGENAGEQTASKKKKKKKKKTTEGMPAQDNSVLRCLGNWKASDTQQTWPPTVGLTKIWSAEEMPVGEIQEYKDQAWRTTSEEMRALEREKYEVEYQKVRRAAEVHRQVRRYVQSYVRPGIPLAELVARLEAKTLELVEKNGLETGWGFPTGCSLNHVAAHYTPNHGDKTVLCYDDVCKLDFGVQVGGRIVDSAFTIAFNPKYDQAIKSTQEGTNVGIREAGVDARFSDIGKAIEEVISSYECEIDGTTYQMKPVRNLNGHSINPYQIHGGKSVPIVYREECEGLKMEEGEFYAIETFASTGKGYVVEDYDCSHYMKVFDARRRPLRLKSSQTLLQGIEEKFGTLAFCRRWLDDYGHQKHLLALKGLVENDMVQPYPPLVDVKGSYVTQMEHTILIKPTGKEVVSRGDDY